MRIVSRRGTSPLWTIPGFMIVIFSFAPVVFGVADMVGAPLLCTDSNGTPNLCYFLGNTNTNSTTTTTTVGPGATTTTSTTSTTNPGNNQLLTVSATASPTTTSVGSSVAFSAGVANGVSPYLFTWYFQDGTSSSLQNPSHSFAAASIYRVTVFVVDHAGNTGQETVPVQVTGGASAGCPSTSSPCVIFIVTSSKTNNPIAGASVTVSGVGTKTTDSNGQAAFNLPIGAYSASFSATNFRSWTETIQVTGSSSVPVTLVNAGGGLSAFGILFGSAYGVPGIGELLIGIAGLFLGASLIAVGRRK